VSTLWTPDGEHRVTRETEQPLSGSPGAPPPAHPSSSAPGPQGAAGPDSDDDSYTEEEMRELARSLLAAPVEDVIANHCYGLFELAALHLSQQPANLDAARTAVDAMGALVEGLGARLGQHHSVLAEGLAQLRVTWVRISDAQTSPGNNGGPT
jgi:hypothetical protein